MHHITSSDSDTKPQLGGAIIQSPTFFPQMGDKRNDEIYNKFLELTKAKDMKALWTTDTKVLQDANAKMVYETKYGSFNFGPTLDTSYVLDVPGKLLAKGDVKIPALLLGHEKLDGLLFTPPWIRNAWALNAHLGELFPDVPQGVLEELRSKYPIPERAGSRAALTSVADCFDDMAIQCNLLYLTEAALASEGHLVYKYIFNALPATHGYDNEYTFYPSSPLPAPVDETLAKFFQKGIVDFVRFLHPVYDKEDVWEEYTSDERKVMNLGKPGQTKPDYSYSFDKELKDSGACEVWRNLPQKSATSQEKAQNRFVVQDGAQDKQTEEL
ncbi:MAG: hypothetical protein Q9168_006964 [Polycauliona sp. 1 TL-2023]